MMFQITLLNKVSVILGKLGCKVNKLKKITSSFGTVIVGIKILK